MFIDEQLEWTEIMFRFCISLAVIGAFVGGCSALNNKLGLDDDHPLEEFLEEQIGDRTGLDVDLTPETEENHS